jgi:EmrB/QacA subfamily drug resistance transporter
MVISGVAMLNNALPHIAEALGLSQSNQQWVVDGYTLALAALLLPAGALGDRFGRRRALLTGVVVLGVGSLFAATAHSAGALIAARALSGAGAALIMPGTLSTITSVFPPEGRAKAVGIWAGFAFAGGTLGMFISGALVDSFYWGSIFLVTAGAALLTLIAVIAVVPETKSSERVGLDPVGGVLSAAGIGAIVLAIIEGPVRGWTDLLTVSALIAGAALVVAFVQWEARRENPLLDPRLFRYRGFATGSASLFLLFLAMFGFFFVGVQYLQLVLGYGALKAAVAVLPMSLVALPVSTVAASLSERLGQRPVMSVGFVMAAGGLALMSFASADTGYWLFLVASLVLAVGVGLSMTPATNAIVKSLPAAKQGVASAVNDTAREIGSAFGVAILGSAFNIGYRHTIDPNLGSLPSGVAAGAHEAPAIALRAAGGLGARGVQLATDTRVAFMSGLRYGLVVAAIALLVGALYVGLRAPDREEEADVVDGGELPEAEFDEAPATVEVPQAAAAVAVPAGASEG